MAASAGISFDATTLGHATTSGGSYTTVFEITDMGGLGETATPIDMTHTTSPDDRREYIPGLSDGKDFSLTLNYSRTDAGVIETLYNTAVWFKITLKNADTFVFSGILNDFEHLGSVGDKVSSNVSIKITGKVDFTSGA